MKKLSFFLSVAILSCLFVFPVFANSKPAIDDYSKKLIVPEELQPWIPWVLYGVEQKKCSGLFQQTNQNCLWAEPLSLSIEKNIAYFSQNITVEYPGWIYLPGKIAESWPENVQLDSKTAIVVEKNSRPAVFIDKAGSHSVSGNFHWNNLPEYLDIPEETGLISPISLNGTEQKNLTLKDGKLWLNITQKKEAQSSNALELQVFRLITDSAPLKITTRIELNVSGDPREILLDWYVPDNQIPLTMQSDLPVKLEEDKRLRVQIRPGEWTIHFVTRAVGEITSLQIGQTGEIWPKNELWSFDSQNYLRVVEIKGVSPVDPSQELIPQAWKHYPAYRMKEGNTFVIDVKKRGDATPAPDNLELQRIFWLDESGEGMTVKDIITGTISSGWRLEMQPFYSLGRVNINGKDQLITHLEGKNIAGIEVRQGNVQIESLSRTEHITDLLAVGWDHDMKKVSAVLNLPPGWKLIYQTGIDTANSWVAKWTLFDIFIVLIISLSIGKLIGIKSGVLGLVTLITIYHEPNAPRYIWLPLLFCAAILRVIPQNIHAKHVRTAKYALLALLVFILIPFITKEIRYGLYPQLEKGRSHQYQQGKDVFSVKSASNIARDEFEPSLKELENISGAPSIGAKVKKAADDSKRIVQQIAPYERKSSRHFYQSNEYDSAAKVQSGPGLPIWNWNSIMFHWNGPVEVGQKIKLYFLTPFMNLILSFVKSILLICLIFVFVKDELNALKKGKFSRKFCSLVVTGLFLSANIYPNLAHAEPSSIPDAAMLESLKGNLISSMNLPADCQSHCVDISSMDVSINNDIMDIDLKVFANIQIAVPLPQSKNWLFGKILINNNKAPLFKDDKNVLWALVGPGENHIVLSGFISRQSIQISFPSVVDLESKSSKIIAPHKVVFEGNNLWEIQGVNPNGIPGSQLGFQKIEKDREKKEILEMGTLPPLVRIERILHLGLEWRITTIATRMSPAGSPILLEIPVLDRESVVNQIPVKNGKVQLQLANQENSKTWESVYSQQKEFTLTASDSQNFVEIWTLDAGSMWHVDIDGIPAVKQQTESKIWQPQWYPWPNESLHFVVTKPAGLEGPTKTIESSVVVVDPGLRATDYDLAFALRSTRGDTHTIKLPEGAVLQKIKINNTEQPIRQSNRMVTIPVAPGQQNIAVNWRMSQDMKFSFRVPEIDLGMESVNNAISVNFGKRWILFVKGPSVGPAILFYSELFIILVGSIILGSIRLTPLRWFHWLLLGLGLSQAGLVANGVIVCWFLVLGLKKKYLSNLLDKGYYNLIQLGIIGFTVVSFGFLLYAIQVGLLGHPDMIIEGNNSTNYILKWYQDRVVSTILPQPFIFSVPIIVYRGIMLAWALWLSFSLLKWLKWGWQECFAAGDIWKKIISKNSPAKEINEPPDVHVK